MIYYNKYPKHVYKAISDYKEVDNPDDWLCCPICGVKPIVWEFDNGRSTACGCGENEYNHFSIHAESINSVIKHSENGMSSLKHDTKALMTNWIHWVLTKEILFEANQFSLTGRW